jgi:hypothetical protein
MPETVFSITSTIAMVAWVALIAARFIPALRRWVDPAVSYVVPALLSVVYGVLLFGYWGQSDGGGFASLSSVSALFAVPELLLAGWIHYLAFDLFVGGWIARTGSAAGINPVLLTPILLATFLAGPVGYLAYALLRPVISPKVGS